MRNFIFTERERRLLKRWLVTGEEDGQTRKVLTWVRQRSPRLAEDVDLMLMVVRELRRRSRWRGRMTEGSKFGSALRHAESRLTQCAQ